jgi:hypothetical protein
LQAYIAGTSQDSLDDLIQGFKEAASKAEQCRERRATMFQLLNAEWLQPYLWGDPVIEVSWDR